MNTSVPLSISTSFPDFNRYSDSRTHGYDGPTRNVRMPRATPSGGGAIAKSEDGVRCAVTGKESLRIIRISDSPHTSTPGHKYTIGRGGHRIDASRNFWEGSGLKIDSASTDVAWGHGVFNNKILTSARNGELIMWDLNKSGSTKYERRTKDHIRSINTLSVSNIVNHYCITGSADGDLRIWDLRDLTKSLMRIHHPISVRSLVFSPSSWQPLQAVVGLDNGSIYRWDLKMGQRGQLDRVPVAHSRAITTLDWCNEGGVQSGAHVTDGPGKGHGWIVSGGLDRCVKVWDLTAPVYSTRIPHKPTYTLHPSFPVRRVMWRPSYECEIAIVSNAEFGTGSNSDLNQNSVTSNVTRNSLPPQHSNEGVQAVREQQQQNAGGDAIEIWDVRRGWIAKWCVTGSAIEGGVTDIAFGDSHAIWSQHSSGMFSQIDLRDAIKPSDAVPRVAATWEASGSLTFVADKKTQWEVPYDDVRRDKPSALDERKFKYKALGDKPCAPLSQNMGNYCKDTCAEELEVFTKLARGYIFEGMAREVICSFNAEVAFQAGKDRAAQTWLLISSSLTNVIPDEPIPAFAQNPLIPHSKSAPAALPQTFPPLNDPVAPTSNISPGHSSVKSVDHRSTKSVSTPRVITPSSSRSASPIPMTSPLPPITPRQSSLTTRHDTESSRRPSMLRRFSVSSPSTHSSSPIDKSFNLRQIGEGALDDSDSSGSGGGDRLTNSGDEELDSVQSRSSSVLLPAADISSPPPWEDDKDDDEASSPSPKSTDTESEGSPSIRKRSKSSRRSVTRLKARSRSSTVASLAASPFPRSLVKQESHSSIKTVLAGEVSFPEQGQVNSLKSEDTLRDIQNHSAPPILRPSHNRQKSLALSELVPEIREDDQIKRPLTADSSRTTDRRPSIVCAEEQKFRRICWDALREALELFADEGDVQMCAMLSIIAPEELRINKRRVLQFLDAYIDILTRLRLYTCSAYLRKHVQEGDISGITKLETTIYTSCGRCRKPLAIPAGGKRLGALTKGGFSYCLTCRTSCVSCSICRLPVRTLLFQCSVCSHGGHQACYQRYYMQRPMVELPTSFHMISEIRGRPVTRNVLSNGGDDDDAITVDLPPETSSLSPRNHTKLIGHPCAAGCGHFCWAANGNIDV